MRKEELSENITMFEIQASDIARKAKPGNFFMLRTHEQGEEALSRHKL
jgi:ferredoxin--NADP+ reductase